MKIIWHKKVLAFCAEAVQGSYTSKIAHHDVNKKGCLDNILIYFYSVKILAPFSRYLSIFVHACNCFFLTMISYLNTIIKLLSLGTFLSVAFDKKIFQKLITSLRNSGIFSVQFWGNKRYCQDHAGGNHEPFCTASSFQSFTKKNILFLLSVSTIKQMNSRWSDGRVTDPEYSLQSRVRPVWCRGGFYEPKCSRSYSNYHIVRLLTIYRHKNKYRRISNHLLS